MTAAARERENGIEGIVVLGMPRSGTTLLRRILDAHPQIASPPETYVLRAAARFLESQRTGVGVDVGVVAGLGHAGFPEDEVLRRLRDLAFGFLRDHAARAGKPLWAEKTAFDGFHADTIRRLCGDRVKFVCIVRHALDVAVSVEEFTKKTGSYLFELHGYVQRDADPLHAFTTAWCDVNESLARLVAEEPARATWLRYEDLVAAPDDTLAKLFAFLGVDEVPGLAAAALGRPAAAGLGDWKTHGKDKVDDASVGRWKTLPQPVRAKLGARANPLLAKLGYDAVPLDALPLEGSTPGTRANLSPEEARRRYEMLLQASKMAGRSK